MKKVKQVLAILMIIVLLSLYAWSLVAAIMAKTEEAGRVFWAAVFTTIFFPILLHVFIWVAELVKGKGAEDTQHQDEQG